MAIITIDIDTSKEEIYLLGDIAQLIANRFAMRYMKDYLKPRVESEKIIISAKGGDSTKILSDVRSMLLKYGFEEVHSNSSEKVLLDFYEEERKFAEFSQKALEIRENHCDPTEFSAFMNIVASNLSHRSLYPLQLLSAYHLSFSQNSCNFSVPGAGKTTIVYGAYTYLKNLPEDDPKKIDCLLIVGPLSSFGPWEMEYNECFGTKPHVKRLISGSSRDEKTSYLYSRNPAEITLISYASLNSLQEDVEFFLKYNRVMVVLDEAHKAKNTSGGSTAKSVLEIAKHCKSRIVLTGTPAPNGYEDLYNLFKFIWPSKNVMGFAVNQLRDMSSRSHDVRVDKLIKNISPYFIRIKKNDLGIPAAHPPYRFYVEMDTIQRRIYDFIEKRYIDSLKSERVGSSSRFKEILVRAKLVRLMQAASNPAMLKTPLQEFLDYEDCPREAYQAIDDTDVLNEILDYELVENPAKYIAVREIVDKIIKGGGKAVIWATFINTIYKLKEYLAQHGIRSQELYGAIPVEREGADGETDEIVLTRERIIREFHKADCPYRVIIANPFAVSESISLHKVCHHAIYIERSFNAAHFVQSKDRIHRYGLAPDDETYYYFIISKNSIDETVDDRLSEKEHRMTEIMESMPIPLFDNAYFDLGDEDIKALIRDYAKRTK
jgi:SNF2 family DNA or RNA helicase